MGRKPSNYIQPDPEQQLAQARERTAAHLAGTLLRPTPVCRECGHHATVKKLTLEMDEGRGVSGTAVDIHGALCLANREKCGCTVVQDGDWRGDFNWRYGTQRVKVVGDVPYIIKQMPFNFTDKQRQAMEAFMAETDPNKRAA